MDNSNTGGEDRRARTQKEVKQIITERNHVFSLYFELAKFPSFHMDDNNEQDAALDLLQEFCQTLIDYIASGQFEIYQRLIDGEERRSELITLAENTYPKISEITTIAVNFNDKYDCARLNMNDSELLQNLPNDLSVLGEALANRTEMEDEMINALLGDNFSIATAASA